MSPTNFDLAPPGKTVDGVAAVPIDVQHIDATLTFDGATSSASGDATLDFVVGPAGGCPIFDLRQTITGAWLDGAALALSQVARHDFGGGAGAELLVVDSPQPEGSSHTLRVTYALGPPQASAAGSYQPALTWSAGPRLRLTFGFTDLGPGRYLEAWIPANLIFDQFSLDLELRILNTSVAHVPITNGAVTSLGSNHWSVAFPARFTAFSHLLELRASDTVTSQATPTTLPVSGAAVSVEAWKLVGSAVSLGTELANLVAWLAANENSTGPYLHGSRYVAFLNVGGMEYDGGTTSSAGSLRHEAFHSWWGRGVKPASQVDGWWDEAWTVYNDLGAAGALPFDYTAAPVQLSSRNPWVRTTPGASYTSGERFFEGAASLVGVANLRSYMRSFYAERSERPATTPDLEAFLVSRSGAPGLVDAFHRFIYGFADPSPAPDLWIKDDPGDPGSNLWAGAFWNSPDLWIRNADDGGTTHQSPEFGQDNWFHARVRNRSANAVARHFLVTFNIKPFLGTEFVYPGDFLPCIAAVAGFELGPGNSTVVKARWPEALVPAAGTHTCWLASVLTRLEMPAAGAHVWEHSNLAQKNLVVADVVPGDWFIVPLVLDRLQLGRRRQLILELVRPRKWSRLEAALLHPEKELFAATRPRRAEALVGADALAGTRRRKPKALLDCGGRPGEDGPEALGLGEASAVAFRTGRSAEVPLRLPGRGQVTFHLALRAPEDAAPGDVFHLDLLQHDERSGRVTGGIAVQLHARKRR